MMNTQTKIDLITIVTETDDLNQIIEEERTTASVFAEVRSVSQSEFFEGGRLGFQPELQISMYYFEYNNEKIVEVNGKRYSVYRTYNRAEDDRIELYLEEKEGTANGPSSNDSTP